MVVRSNSGRNCHWAATGKTLHNDEKEKTTLDLKQDGAQLTGTVQGLGFIEKIRGIVSGNHFEMFGVDWNNEEPFIVVDLVGGELHGKQWGKPFAARPATSADDFPEPKYIDPPALRDVTYNGLAKTPPMGWNSWNLFADKVDDRTVRTMADAMVSSGMRDAGYIYVNIDDTWELSTGDIKEWDIRFTCDSPR